MQPTAKKTQNFKKEHSLVDQSLSNLVNTKKKANALIEQMRVYTEYLAKIEVAKFSVL